MVDSDVNRRDVVKIAGSAGIATLGATSNVVASRDADPSEIEGILASAEVEAIRKAVKNLQLHPRRAEISEVVQEEATAGVRVIRVPGNFGELQVIEFDESDAREVLFNFTVHRPDIEYDWPRGTDAKLIASGEDIVFTRTATHEEAQTVAKVLGSDPDGLEVGTSSQLDGYHAVKINSDYNRLEVSWLKAGAARTTELADAELNVVHRNVYEPDPNELTAASCDCGEIFAQVVLCISQISSCRTCYQLLGLPWVGPKAVAACVIATGCLSLADLWTGCTELPGHYGCFTDCLQEAYDDIGNPLT